MAMYQIECAYTCHTGNIRANNEDNFWCFGESLPVNNEGTKGICSKIISGNRVPAMAVFDGMGGESCGEIAAFLASEEFGKFYNANKRMLRVMPEDFIDNVRVSSKVFHGTDFLNTFLNQILKILSCGRF